MLLKYRHPSTLALPSVPPFLSSSQGVPEAVAVTLRSEKISENVAIETRT